jgi:hypothetical protein
MAIYIAQELQNGRQVGDPVILDAANLALAKRMATCSVSMGTFKQTTQKFHRMMSGHGLNLS